MAESKWDSAGIGGNSSQQYARTLMRLGWEVGYLEPKGTWRLKRLDRVKEPGSAIVMCSFPYTGYNLKVFSGLAAQGCRSVCLIVDHWKEIGIEGRYNPELEAEFVKSARYVFACSPLNVERLKPLRPDVKLLRNGVDLVHFTRSLREGAVSVPRGRITLGVVAGFWIFRWVDLDPLLEYARNHPEDTVNIIGRADSAIGRGGCPPNVILHGVRHWNEIPEYLHQFDVCVVPYNPEETRYTNPIKVLEYLACRKPVVSCFNSSISDYPYVNFYNGKREFEDAVGRAVSCSIDEDFLADFLKKATWEERIKKIVGEGDG